jgi:hypothetical protein
VVTTRPAAAALPCLLLAACTGGSGEPEEPAPPATPTLRLTVASAGFADGLGRVRVSHQVRLGRTRASGCREAGIVGSLNGGAWSVPFNGSGEWCGPWAAFTCRLAGRQRGEGRLEYRHDPPAARHGGRLRSGRARDRQAAVHRRPARPHPGAPLRRPGPGGRRRPLRRGAGAASPLPCRLCPPGGHDLPVTIAGQPIAQVLWDFVAAHPIPGQR